MTQQKIIDIVLPILKQYGVERASLFGSYVRGDYDEKSDVDLLIEPAKNTGLFELADLKFTLEKKLSRKVDIVNFKYINKYLKPYILQYEQSIL